MSIFSNIGGVLLKLKKRSKRKNIDFDLDKKWLEQKLNSGLCKAYLEYNNII